MCLNIVGKNYLRYATKDIVCYKVLKIQNRSHYNTKNETLHAPYYDDFKYILNKKYNTEIKLHGGITHVKDTSGLYYKLNFEIAQAINQYYDRLTNLKFITCGFHTLKTLHAANCLKKEFIDDNYSFYRDYRVFECVIPKGSWYYIGFDDSFNNSFVSDSLIIKREIKY